MASNTRISSWVEGSKVQGVYFDAKFTGTVKSMRQHSKNRRITEIVVTFDVPVMVNNDMRPDCAFYAYEDGKHWSDPAGYIESYTGGDVSNFKVGNRVEVLVDRTDNPISEWHTGRIVGSQTIGGVSYWHVHVDGTASLDHVNIDQRKHATHLKHSDAPLPDTSGELTQRQKDSGRFANKLNVPMWEYDKTGRPVRHKPGKDATTPAAQNEGASAPVDIVIDEFQVGDRFNECDYAGNTLSIVEITQVSGRDNPYYTVMGNIDGTPFDWKYTYDELKVAIEVGHLAPIDKRVIVGEVVSVTNDQPVPAFQVGDLILTSENEEPILYQVVGTKYGIVKGMEVSPDKGTYELSLFANKCRHATLDEKMKYLTSEADRLDTVAAQAIYDRTEVMRQIERLRNERFYNLQVEKSVNFRANYPTLQDYLNSLTGR